MTYSYNSLSKIADMLSDDGELFDAGCSSNQIDHFIEISRNVAPKKQVCVVKNWMWWDLQFSEAEIQRISKLGLKAAMIKSDYVIEDEAGRFNDGDWVRSSCLKQFHASCLFETQNTVYLLVGSGTRKTIQWDEASRVF
jgi:hypothetical protein